MYQPDPVIEGVQKEIATYLQEGIETKSVQVLHYWASRQNSLPTLALMARRYLCIPATSASSERVFSKGRRIVSWQRSSLKPSTIEELICLKDWFQTFDGPFWLVKKPPPSVFSSFFNVLSSFPWGLNSWIQLTINIHAHILWTACHTRCLKILTLLECKRNKKHDAMNDSGAPWTFLVCVYRRDPGSGPEGRRPKKKRRSPTKKKKLLGRNAEPKNMVGLWFFPTGRPILGPACKM